MPSPFLYWIYKFPREIWVHISVPLPHTPNWPSRKRLRNWCQVSDAAVGVQTLHRMWAQPLGSSSVQSDTWKIYPGAGRPGFSWSKLSFWGVFFASNLFQLWDINYVRLSATDWLAVFPLGNATVWYILAATKQVFLGHYFFPFFSVLFQVYKGRWRQQHLRLLRLLLLLYSISLRTPSPSFRELSICLTVVFLLGASSVPTILWRAGACLESALLSFS